MTTGEAEKLLSAKGYLKSRSQAMIGTKIPGRVERMYVHEGMKVKKGDTLAVIEHNDMMAMLASREGATDEESRRSWRKPRPTCGRKSREERRLTRLHSQQKVTEEEYEKGISGLKKAKARVAALHAGIKLTQANIQEIQATINTMSLYAPFDGTVVEKQGEEGEIISPMAMSSSLGRTAVVTIANLETMDVETDISENLMSRIALGQPAEVSVSAIPSKRYRGRLRQVIPMGDRTRGTVKVKVEILDPDEKLFPELAATVHFLPSKTGNSPDASRSFLFVPKSAVFQENGHDYVWVVGRRTRCISGRSRWRPRPTPWGGSSRASMRASRSCSTRSSHSTKRKSSGSPTERRPPGHRHRKAHRSWPHKPRSSCGTLTRNTAATSSGSPCWWISTSRSAKASTSR